MAKQSMNSEKNSSKNNRIIITASVKQPKTVSSNGDKTKIVAEWIWGNRQSILSRWFNRGYSGNSVFFCMIDRRDVTTNSD